MMPGVFVVMRCMALQLVVFNVGDPSTLSVQLYQASPTLLLDVVVVGVGLFRSFHFG
jgi:hypothetical protein